MAANNFRYMPGVLFYLVRINMLICSIKLLFYYYLLGILIIDQLFLGLINTLGFYKII